MFAWSNAILISEQAGSEHKKPVVCFSPAGKIYVVYEAGTKIHLSSFDGSKVAYEKKISESSLLAYEASMWINKRGFIHIAWVENSSYDSYTQYVKYRFYNGSSWSAVSVLRTLTITGALRPPFVNRRVEDLRLTADENDNVFIVYMVQPAARCQFISKYGSTIKLETWPMAGRSKHPDVAVDASYIHIAWQQLWDNLYTIAYCKRTNTVNGKFQTVIDVRDGIHRPRVAVDPSRVPHVFYMADDGSARVSIYKYWTGNGFSPKFIVSDDAARSYSNIGLSVVDKNNIFTVELAGRIYYNWKQNGVWSGHLRVDTALSQPDYTSCALSPDAKTAVVAYTNGGDSVCLNLSSDTISPPGPPPPIPIPNKPPIPLFTFTPISGLYPLSVNFNASNSKDLDGEIVSYNWDFGDGSSGKGKIVTHVYQSENRFEINLRIVDNIGASATATGELEVFGIAPPLNVQYQRHVNRNLFSLEYLYRITWNHNPRNDEVGARIVAYKIYRREIGKGGFSHFYTLQTGNQSDYEYLDRSLGSVAREYEYAISSVDGVGRESAWGQ
ncbi:MAG: PKD domain-containing protein [Candidatus Aminicenantes bacterium]|nr:PKD domain-containing protein [Candidatus Aminicenantes bacterium]